MQNRNEKKRLKRNEDSLGELWDNVKHTNIQIIWVPEEEREKGTKKILKEIKDENFLTWGRNQSFKSKKPNKLIR